MKAAPVRPKGMPRTEWKALQANPKPKQKQPAPQQGKWHFAANANAFGYSGAVSVGSGDKAQSLGRAARADSDDSGVRRELMCEVFSSQGFKASQYPIQPALSNIFPWVGSIAAKYQKWRCVSMMLEYIPTVEAFADAGKQGRVVLAANYDSLDPAFTSIVQAETVQPNAPTLPTRPTKLMLDPRQITSTPKLVRSAQVPPGGTITAYDGGVMYVCTNGAASTVPDGTKLGEVFVHYKFDFYNPIILGQGVVPAPTHSARVSCNLDVVTSFPATTWSTLPDLAFNSTDWNGLGITISGNTLTIPAGRYRISGASQFTFGLGGTFVGTRFLVNGLAVSDSHSLTYTTIPSGATSSIDWDFTLSIDAPATINAQVFPSNVISALSSYWPRFTIVSI